MEKCTILAGRTSYGMKHILHDDTEVYLTNNQFKDAMLLAGYKPVDPNELNWRYWIALTRDINVNPSPFFRWIIRYADESSPRGDFVRGMKLDFQFPALADHGIIQNYLERICRTMELDPKYATVIVERFHMEYPDQAIMVQRDGQELSYEEVASGYEC